MNEIRSNIYMYIVLDILLYRKCYIYIVLDNLHVPSKPPMLSCGFVVERRAWSDAHDEGVAWWCHPQESVALQGTEGRWLCVCERS